MIRITTEKEEIEVTAPSILEAIDIATDNTPDKIKIISIHNHAPNIEVDYNSIIKVRK